MSKVTKEQRTLRRMIDRCHDDSHPRYPWYGARGISVCAEWRDPVTGFSAFLAHAGRAPSPAHTIDRIENDGDYEPGNVRWATWLEQAQNRRTSQYLTHCNQTLTIAEWARKKGMDRRILWKRINLFDWPVAKAIETPVAARKKRQILAFPTPDSCPLTPGKRAA